MNTLFFYVFQYKLDLMTINCQGTLIDLQRPKVMGILNLTPDSFFDGGHYNTPDLVLGQVEQMLKEGASFIDVGAYSSRPDAEPVSEALELERLIPMVRLLVQTFPTIRLSIDTFRASVAKAAIEAGGMLINDISGGVLDAAMLETVGALQVPYIMMHMRGTPQTMKTLTNYEDVTQEVLQFFSRQLAQARAHKINDLIIDPGFGFAKTTAQNFELLSKLELLGICDVPVLIGVSRKSMIYKTLGVHPEEALNATTALHMVALQKGSSILRVHDVKEAMECIRLYEML
tara:strand:- start:59 stop:922 length:864 start_codon:yes stop_codon:yes gene_type:complete